MTSFMPRFKKVYGQVDPAAEARRMTAMAFSCPERPLIPPPFDINRDLLPLIQAIVYERQLERKPVFRGLKQKACWFSDTPVVAAVDWSPPAINPKCEFRVPEFFPGPMPIAFC